MKKRLSTSVYTFESIITQNGMYVDKTKEIFEMVDALEGQFFLARPRRFGKSLTLSTLKAIFEGKKDLFKGLYIHDKLKDWQQHPIIHLALNKFLARDANELEENLCLTLHEIAESYKITLRSKRSYQLFSEIINNLYQNDKKVVLLIDEYDKPILDNVIDKDNVKNILKILKGFYGVIKAQEEKIRFSFITGVSKFSKVSIFSDLNNLTDITMDTQYATLCGFTQEESEHYFADYIEENSKKLNLSKAEYLQKLKAMYDGIRFTEKDVMVYNPVSFTNAMKDCKFKNHWFETGTPTFLLKMLKEQDYDLPKLESLKLKSYSFSTFEVDNIQVEALLYQTGYLTIKDYVSVKDDDYYVLGYPNLEVRKSVIERLVDYFTPVRSTQIPTLINRFIDGVENKDFDQVRLR